MIGDKPLTRSQINKCLAVWSSAFPPLYPVVVRRPHTAGVGELEGCWAWTEIATLKKEKRLVITLPTTTPAPADFLVFIHEFAHCMVWRPDHQETDDSHHNDEWGCAHARLWRLVLND